MAYLERKALTCPTCGKQDEIRVVVGVGPHSAAGDSPYRNYKTAGNFLGHNDDPTIPKNQLLCPDDRTIVWKNTAGSKADPK